MGCLYDFIVAHSEFINVTLRFLQILITAGVLIWIIPFLVQKNINKRNAIKESLKDDLKFIETLILSVHNQLKDLSNPSNKKTQIISKNNISESIKNIGFYLQIILKDLKKDIEFITNKNERLLEKIKIQYLRYEEITDELGKQTPKISKDYIHLCNTKKNLLIKELKLFLYKVNQK